MPGGRQWVYVNGELVWEYPWKSYVVTEAPKDEVSHTEESKDVAETPKIPQKTKSKDNEEK